MEIQRFRYEYSSIMYEKAQKRNKIKEHSINLQLLLTYHYIEFLFFFWIFIEFTIYVVNIQHFRYINIRLLCVKFTNNAIKSMTVPLLAVTSGMLIYEKVFIDWMFHLWKFGGDSILQIWKLSIFELRNKSTYVLLNNTLVHSLC